MKDKFLKQTQREYSPRQRTIALIFLAPIFLFLLPYGLVTLGTSLDHWMQWSPILSEPINWIVGCLLIVSGWSLGLWANYAQFTIGRGTPVPLMATQKLIVQPPFNFCRNPMSLGAIVMYSGVGLIFHSIGTLIVVLIFAGCLLTYIKRVEEKEMEIRFGQEYLEYKRKTPFLLPRLRKRP